MRNFETGATRDNEEGKLDFEGFISPLTTRRFAEYMHSHRKQADGKLRASDNWQKGIPIDAYAKSLARHVEDFKLHHRGHPHLATDKDYQNVLCAILFNINGLLFEDIKRNDTGRGEGDSTSETVSSSNKDFMREMSADYLKVGEPR